MSRIWHVCSIIRCTINAYQCCNHKGQLSTAILNTVSPRFSREPLEVPVCLFPPSVSLFLPSHLPLLLPNSLLLSCLFFLLSFADSASISLHPFVLDSLASSVSLLFMFISHAVSVVVTLRPVYAHRHQRRFQTGCPPQLRKVM